jgi:hypothetical protein
MFRFGFVDPATNKVETWWFWDGVKRREVGSITEEQMKMPFEQLWTGSILVERIEEGWTWANYQGCKVPIRNPERIQANESGAVETPRRTGSNLAMPHRMEHYLYLPSKDAAEQVAGKLRQEDFTVEVSPSAMDDGQWLALAVHSVVPGEATMAELRGQFEDLVAKYDGEYDGWQAQVMQKGN